MLKIKKTSPPPAPVPPGPSRRAKDSRVPPGRKIWRKAIAGSGGVALLLLLLFSFLILPEARVTVTVRSEPVTKDFDIRVDKNLDKPDATELSVPGKVVEQEISGNKTFSATGSRNVGRAASGFVNIYNFSKTTLILKAQTTTLTANGRKYRFTQDVGNIRPTALLGLENQEVDPSSLIAPVPIAAVGPGEEYNLSKDTRMEIENEAFGKQPKILYAMASENIAGGTTQSIKVVTAADIASAYTGLAQELVNGARQALVSQNPTVKLLDNAVTSETLEQKSAQNPGAEVPDFEVSMKIKLNALTYDENNVRTVIVERIKRLLPANKKLVADVGTRLQASFLHLNIPDGQGVLSAHFEGQIVYQVDQQELQEKIRGKTMEEIREILLSRPEIEKVDIKFYPFWVKKAPNFGKKVYLQVLEPAA